MKETLQAFRQMVKSTSVNGRDEEWLGMDSHIPYSIHPSRRHCTKRREIAFNSTNLVDNAAELSMTLIIDIQSLYWVA